MIRKIIFIILGFYLITIGITYIFLYINLFTFGYTIKEYFLFIITQIECLTLPLGIIIEILTIKTKKETKDELHI